MGLIGYARVSTAEGRQVLDRQLDALNDAGCERVFEDRASGAASDRPKLAACLDYLRQGDVLVVLDLDRLGRRAGELIALIDDLDHRGVGFRALNSPMDTTAPAGRAFLQIQAAFAEMERNVIRQRIREGVKAARARGRKGGRTLFMIDWALDPAMQRRAQIGLNKGESHHALKNALRIGRQGEIRDRTTEGQHYRMAGLNLLAAIVIYWNTARLGEAVARRRHAGLPVVPELLAHTSPLGWGHILLTGEYRWPKRR